MLYAFSKAFNRPKPWTFYFEKIVELSFNVNVEITLHTLIEAGLQWKPQSHYK